jgi:hypothetical protein
MEDGIDVGSLGHGDGARFVIAGNLDSKEPVQLTQVSDFDVFPYFFFETSDYFQGRCPDCAIVNVYGYNNER